jgi:hypothetical protein
VISGPGFIWLHLPKTGGTAVYSYLKQHVGHRLDMVFDPVDPMWHDTLEKRGLTANGRAVICNIRRLPTWLLSRVYFETDRNPHLYPTRNQFRVGRYLEESGEENYADITMRVYSPEVTDWIRSEDLGHEVARVLGRFLELPPDPIPRLNETAVPYIKSVSFYFTPRELKRLYRKNPVWASVERAVYGDIMTLS